LVKSWLNALLFNQDPNFLGDEHIIVQKVLEEIRKEAKDSKDESNSRE